MLWRRFNIYSINISGRRGSFRQHHAANCTVNKWHVRDLQHSVPQAGGGRDDPVVTAYGDVDRQLDSLSAALDLLVGRTMI